MSDKAVRIVMASPNKRNKRLLLVAPPFPKLGDTITIDSIEWTVIKTSPEKILIRIPRNKVRIGRPLRNPSPKE